MTMGRLALFSLSCAALLAFAGCGDRAEAPADVPAARAEPAPPTPPPSDAVTAVAERLLEAHHLLGRQPEELTPGEKAAPVDGSALAPLVADPGDHDPFIGDLYVGFVVGALARHQGRWVTSIDGDRATIAAGDVRVALVRRGGAWKIDLAASIPDVIKARAAEEKARFDAAKAAGQGTR